MADLGVLVRQLQGALGGRKVRGPFTLAVPVVNAASGSAVLQATVDLPAGSSNANAVPVGLPATAAAGRLLCTAYNVVSPTRIDFQFYNPTGAASVAQTFAFFVLAG